MNKTELELENNLTEAYQNNNWGTVKILASKLMKNKPEYPKGYIYYSLFLFHDKEFEKSKDILDIATKLVNQFFPKSKYEKLNVNQKTDYILYHYIKGLINKKDGLNEEALWSFYESSVREQNPIVASKYANNFSDSYNGFRLNFLESEYYKRKTILVDDSLPKSRPEFIIPILTNHIPDIEFSYGHPVKHTLYVGHPIVKNRYYSLLDYDRCLFDERWDEFMYLLECLGATKIKVEYKKENTEIISDDRSKEVKAKGKLAVHSVSAEIEQKAKMNNNTNYFISKIHNQEFDPVKKPYIPDNLIWYNNEKSWQLLAKQRLDGRILSHNIQFSTKEVVTIDNTELLKIASEYKNVMAGIEIDYKQTRSISTHTENALIWNINVEFKPIQELKD